jgi:hypothetical protein
MSFPYSTEGADPMPLQVEAYVMSRQVDKYCSTPEDREAVLEVLRKVGITKLYLEAIRSGYRSNEKTLCTARDFFRENGIEITVGITTTPGDDFGVRSTENRNFLNYEEAKTREDLKEVFEFMASHFDEIMIDDFFLTDDRSETAAQAKGDRSWSEYRLELMTEVARDWAIGPAKKVNPNVSIILKYPQWYDRFHVYGYNVVSGPALFDTIWVGTETRNPETQRFGFVQPTEGYINYSWLDSLGNGKTQGAWFDPFDCHEDVYLMQAYQSILAGAKNLTLFNLGEYMEENPVLSKLRNRRAALDALAKVVGDRRNRGVLAYKPPHSEPGNDGYLFDFLAVLGIPVSPTGRLPEQVPKCSILTAHSAADPNIASLAKTWAGSGSVVVVTPDFLMQLGDPELVDLAGFDSTLPKNLEWFTTTSLKVRTQEVPIGREARFVKVPLPSNAEVIATARFENEEVPLLSRKNTEGGGAIVFLNVFSFRDDDFDPEVEMFLSPLRLAIPNWPQAFADEVRAQMQPGEGMMVEGAPPFGLYRYGDDTMVLSSFKSEPSTIRFKPAGGSSVALTLRMDFPHVEGASVNRNSEGEFEINLPAWEIVALKVE